MEVDLLYRKKVSGTTTSRIIITWGNYFALGSLPIRPSRAVIDQFTNSCRLALKSYFPNVDLSLLESVICSQYKSHTTLKGLVGISPFGAVTLVSELYTGLISDKEITNDMA